MPQAMGTLNLQDFDEKVKSMMSHDKKGRYLYDFWKGRAIGHNKRSIEANHMEGVWLPCNICENIFRLRSQLRRHRCINDMHIAYVLFIHRLSSTFVYSSHQPSQKYLINWQYLYCDLFHFTFGDQRKNMIMYTFFGASVSMSIQLSVIPLQVQSTYFLQHCS